MEADSLIEENLDLVDKVSGDVIRECRIRRGYWDEVRSAAGLALVIAARKFDPSKSPKSSARLYLRKKMFYLVVDELRLINGRKPREGEENSGGQYVMNMNTTSLNVHSSGRNDNSNEVERVDMVEDQHAQLDFEKVGDDEFIEQFLDALPTDRTREIALRLANGEPMRQIGERFGITESRVSQIVTKLRQTVDPGNPGAEREPELEPIREEVETWQGEPAFLDVSWR